MFIAKQFSVILISIFIFTDLLNAQTVIQLPSVADKKAGTEIHKMSYQDALAAFEKIKEGADQKEILALLGMPNRIQKAEPEQSWYEELWVYDLQKLSGYPKKENLKAVWEINIMFANRKVQHTRKIGWLEQMK